MTRVIRGDLNAVPVKAEDLLKAAQIQRRGQSSSLAKRALAMTRLFKGSPYKSLAIEYRLEAMERVLECDALQKWMAKSTGRPMQAAEVVWVATAQEPLIIYDFGPRFDPASFLQRVMSLGRSRGMGWRRDRPLESWR